TLRRPFCPEIREPRSNTEPRTGLKLECTGVGDSPRLDRTPRLRCAMPGDRPIRVCVAGVTGWTGSAVAAAVVAAPDLELVAGVARSDGASFSSVPEALDATEADVLVDYTSASAVKANVLAAIERNVGVVVGSSGLSAADYDEIDALARDRQVGVIAAGNFSVTAALLLRFATQAARYLVAWEGIDHASATKPDAPRRTS